MQALAGKAPNVNISRSAGIGRRSSIRIRGLPPSMGGRAALVVDGVPMDNSPISTNFNVIDAGGTISPANNGGRQGTRRRTGSATSTNDSRTSRSSRAPRPLRSMLAPRTASSDHAKRGQAERRATLNSSFSFDKVTRFTRCSAARQGLRNTAPTASRVQR